MSWYILLYHGKFGVHFGYIFFVVLIFVTSSTTKSVFHSILSKEFWHFLGISGTLNIFNKRTAKFLNAIRLFDGQKIYGIIPNESRTKLLIHGTYSIKIFKCKFIPALEIEEDSSCVFHDWILSANWINSDHHVVTVTMHNIAVLWTNKLDFIKRAVCEEQCILYSACIYGNKFENLVILSGTVFSELLLWRPSDCSVSFRLKGHKVCSLTKVALYLFSILSYRVLYLQWTTIPRPTWFVQPRMIAPLACGQWQVKILLAAK